jgi:hypothetical protein
MSFTLNSTTQVSGYVTLKKFLVGRNLEQIEGLLGFKKGRLSRGATFAELQYLPSSTEFELAGYSQVAEHHFDKSVLNGLDVAKLKNIVLDAWNQPGEKLVKVIATIPHDTDPDRDEDDQYPPGKGVPQWKLNRVNSKTAIVTYVINDYPGGTYKG